MKLTRRAAGWTFCLGATVALFTGCSSGSQTQVASASSQSATKVSEAAAQPTVDDLASYLKARVTWVECLRDQGVNVSDPDGQGQVTFPGMTAETKADPAFSRAQVACESLAVPVPAELAKQQAGTMTKAQHDELVAYARCMQTHGAPDFPDPAPLGSVPVRGTWDQISAGAVQATRECASIIGDPATPAGSGQG